MADLSGIRTDEFDEAFDQLKEDVTLEFAFEACRYAANRDYRMAVLMAVIALESAHNAFIRYELSKILHGNDKAKASTINDLLREHGFYSISKITPYLFLDENERPSEADLKASLEAISIRNAIMHSLQRKGLSKLRNYKTDDLIKALKGAVAVRDIYSMALLKRQRIKKRENST